VAREISGEFFIRDVLDSLPLTRPDVWLRFWGQIRIPHEAEDQTFQFCLFKPLDETFREVDGTS
jgi:hypothetical protein